MRMTENSALQAFSNLNQRYLDLSSDTANQLLWERESPWEAYLETYFKCQGTCMKIG